MARNRTVNGLLRTLFSFVGGSYEVSVVRGTYEDRTLGVLRTYAHLHRWPPAYKKKIGNRKKKLSPSDVDTQMCEKVWCESR
jgi:hypothetical protein